jgi:hypothetical protein
MMHLLNYIYSKWMMPIQNQIDCIISKDKMFQFKLIHQTKRILLSHMTTMFDNLMH